MSNNQQRTQLISRIRHFDPESFESIALDVFQYQALYNAVYNRYLNLLNVNPFQVRSIEQIPFLPIQLFKSHLIQTKSWKPDQVFTSSGTTGTSTSRHALRSASWYRRNAQQAFERLYGPLKNYCILALLPSYLERSGSSLIFMVADFIKRSSHPESGFFLDNVDQLAAILKNNQKQRIPTVLIGVSFALLDLAETHPMNLSNIIIMETGGMKGRRKEITRGELHQICKNAFQVKQVHSEYGMTELFSQGYSMKDGIFQPSPTMQLLTREITDPFKYTPYRRSGVLNIIDLANLDTISFIATEDLGRVYKDHSFEVLGRLDQSDIRGCNLMVSDLG